MNPAMMMTNPKMPSLRSGVTDTGPYTNNPCESPQSNNPASPLLSQLTSVPQSFLLHGLTTSAFVNGASLVLYNRAQDF